jgi:hypothetical protein
MPDPGSEEFVVYLCDGAWAFDPVDGTWDRPAHSGTAYYNLVSDLVPIRRGVFSTDRPFAAALTSQGLVAAGERQIRSLETQTGRVTVLETDGPSVVSAVAFDPNHNQLIILGDGAIWSYDFDENTLDRLMSVPDGDSKGGMYWRSAAAAFDESADLLVMFDGERTWTFDVESGELHSPAESGFGA